MKEPSPEYTDAKKQEVMRTYGWLEETMEGREWSDVIVYRLYYSDGTHVRSSLEKLYEGLYISMHRKVRLIESERYHARRASNF